uniref:TF-B3 domain-containing protein n=1 Tax=Setaria italica TaxID=4555 RepID=K4AKD6_SETIT
MADAARYEVQRRRQIEENKRRIEELGLRHLAAAAMPPKAKQLKLKHKARAPGAAAPPRRSGRVANLPDQPDYRENVKKKIVIGPTAAERSYAIAKAKAKELEGELRADYPTFLKTVSKEHLPEHGKVITLVDEEDDEFDVQYYKGPNDRGYCITSWRGFATDHKLDDGDCLVFQLIQQRKFK